MTFPQTPLDVRIDLQINGIWTDITSDVYTAEKITITRGRADEAARVDPGKCSLTLNNRLGKYSPRNPMSPYYQLIGRNTPIRVSVNAGSTYLNTTGTIDRARVADTAQIDVTGDIDIRVEAYMEDWAATSTPIEIAGKYSATTGGRAWMLTVYQGKLVLYWSADGTAELLAGSTDVLVPPLTKRMAVRVTMDVNNGASGRTLTFYTAPSINGPWTQLGNQVVQAGTTSIFNNTQPLDVGAVGPVSFPNPVGRYYAFQLRNGINGTLAASVDFTTQTVGATSLVDSTGLTWTLDGNASISNRSTRFVGEVSSWPSRWDVSGKDIRVPIEAAGVLRRYGQGKKAIDSTLRRRIPTFSPAVYWPFEEPQGATQAYSPIPGIQAVTPTGVQFGADDTLGGASTMPSWDENAVVSCPIPGTVPGGAWQLECVMRLDSMPTSLETFIEVSTTGTAKKYRISLQTNNVRVEALDDDGTVLGSINSLAPAFTGLWNRFQVWAQQNGSNVDMRVGWLAVGSSGLTNNNSYAGTEGRPTNIRVFGTAGNLRLGHLALFPTTNSKAFAAADDGFAGETAGTRITRIAAEEGKPIVVYGAAGELVGAQKPSTFLDLVEEATDVDGGILYERRDSLGLIYRDRISLYNQPVALTLDYTADGHVAPPLEPVDDDQTVRNDRTIQRAGGSSSRAVLSDGPLSVQDPPDGVGPYDDSETLNLYTDDQTVQQAGWRLHLGTVDEARYPVVNINLAAAPELIDQVLEMDSGSRAQIINPPSHLPPGPIDLLAQGYTEVIGHPTDWDVSLNCTPASPWTVAVAGDPVLGKADTEGTELTSALTSTDTVALVTTSSGPVWTSNLAQTPFDWKVGGEVVRVLAPGPMTNANALFEAGIGSWSGTNATISPDTALPRPHPYALGLVRVTPSGGTFSVLAGTTLGPGTAGPNGRYQLSAWVYSPNGWASGLQLQANWFNGAGTYLTTTGGTITAVLAGTWTQLLDVVVSPAGADRAQVLIRQNGTPNTGDLYYAWCVQISRVSAAAVYDEFGRSVTGSWGAADSLQTWTLLSGGTNADFSVTSGYGRHINTAVSAAHHTLITSPSADFDIYCDIAVAALSTAASQFAGILARFVDGNNLYESRVEFTTANAIILSLRKRVAGTETQLATFTSSLTNVAGTFVRVRFQGTGASLRARIWAPGGEEPTAWHVDVTDTAFSAAGSIGMKSVRNAGNTNANAESRFDNFALINPQQFTVARSLNGIVKAQSAGTDVRLSQPAVAAL